MDSKRGFILSLLVLAVLILPISSAEILINQQPLSVYNLGDIITIPVTLKTASGTSGTFQMNLICEGSEINFYRNGVSLNVGEEKRIESSLILSKQIIGTLKGTCSIKASLNQEFVVTNTFEISDRITIESNISKTEFNPLEKITIKGKASKENGKPVNGFIEVSILDGNKTVLVQPETVNNGDFSVELTLPKDIRAGSHLLRVRAYERDMSEQETNFGVLEKTILIHQVPTSLDIFFEAQQIEPGTNVKTKAVLYDQTGVKIDSSVFLTIKNGGKILDQREVSTDEFIEFPIQYNEPPATWKVVAVSSKLTSESSFEITAKENADIEIQNNTVLITNTGNVPYNRTVLIKIGNNSNNLDVYLDVDESQRWLLTAPDGEYSVQVSADGKMTGASVALTGDAIDIRKASAGALSLMKFPLVWLFILAVLGFVAFIFFKRGYQRSFIGYITSPRKGNVQTRPMSAVVQPGGNMYIYNPQSAKAVLELSIKGDKQEVSMIALKLKNKSTIINEPGVEELLTKVKNIAEDEKAATYENGEDTFFIFSPARTKTFKNEIPALKVAQKIKDALVSQNKLFKNKLDFGMSLTKGSIVAKQESDCFKFMALGALMTESKKIAAAADGELLLSRKLTDTIRTSVKAEKHTRGGMEVYIVKEIKNPEEHEKFLKKFMGRQEKG